MDLKNLTIGIVFLLQSIVGIVGNFSLLSCYLIRYYNKQTLKTTDLILTHMFIANILIILSKGFLHTMRTFGIKGFINYFGCEFLLYIQRLGRSMSICTTCILSVFQAITISPGNSFWLALKVKAPKYIVLVTSFCWILYLSGNITFPVYMYTKGNSNSLAHESDKKYCSTAGHDALGSSLYTVFFVLPEILLSVIIIWSSCSMVVILYRHNQRVQHIRSSSVSFRTSTEYRATHRILAFVSVFIGFHSLSSILQGCIALIQSPHLLLVNITAIISTCFPSLGPFLMSHDYKFKRFCFS
ncbi:vomeronasal type-1 receptor 4-like [Phodopus roborovskii]|uniref:vomeronasal type-1 receptor 4-like n=1 Tax=Phodopus roborovskii TaxID=109678 RepID=UPI0021E4333A|nr:vomeronasal type-1 receptor 4-like [Phodopus roborovskii]